MSSIVSIILAFMLMIGGNPGYINSPPEITESTIENPTTFEKEKTINFDKLHNILSIVENYNGQTKTITTDIPENSDYSKLNQYASFDQWGLDYDKKGNTTQKGTLQLSYDYRNQLVTAVDAPSNTQVEMKYDVLGRRIQKSVTIGSQTKIENYYHSGHQVIEVRDENDQLLRQYIYGNGIDEIIRMDKYENGTVTAYYYHTDTNGSVTAITDSNGQLVERVTYNLYGMPTFWDASGNVISKSSIGNNILFHGREYDSELNLYYFRARYYDPIMGRFLQTDPMGYADSMNLYQGFYMNPFNFTDPWGLNLKLSGSEMQQFESNLTDILIELYSSQYDEETAAQLIDFVIYHATLENKVWAFNDLTGLNLEVPEKLGVLGKIFGAAKSYANFSKKVGAKVKQWLGADEAQERIDSAKDHWLVQEGVTLPGHLTIGDQLNLAFAEGAADIAEFTTEELQWSIVAGVSGKVLQKARKLRKGKKIKGGPKFPDLKGHARRHSHLHTNAYYNKAVRHMKTGRPFKVRHEGKTKIVYITRKGEDRFMFTSTNQSGTVIYTHMDDVTEEYLLNKGITLPKGF
jgi:RHS repeat-associated protein